MATPAEAMAGQPNDKSFIADEWLQLERDVLKRRPLTTGTVQEVRTAYATISGLMAAQYPPPSSYAVREYKLYTDKGLPLRVYAPAQHPEGEKLLPVGMFAHGGGHVVGGAWASSFEDRMCRFITEKAQCVIVQVDFKLAPECPAPSQVDECYDAFLWCYEHADALHGDTSRFFSAGSSLGGGIAFAVALRLLDNNHGPKNKGIVSLCPALLHPWNVPDEYKDTFKAYEETWNNVPMQDGESMIVFYGHNGGNQQTANPYVFPLLHPGLKLLPPTYQAVCGCDPVRDDATVMRNVLDKHKIANKWDIYPGMPHYFWVFPQLPSSLKFHEDVAEGVKWVIGQMTV